jgi:hypothetical protein
VTPDKFRTEAPAFYVRSLVFHTKLGKEKNEIFYAAVGGNYKAFSTRFEWM